ncbi:hypothetical protein KAR91_30810 [Candidatus Pacearchaeota archaeon]|nr:hypothetical protein [Candidatus Pacearchaeota archaeon]
MQADKVAQTSIEFLQVEFEKLERMKQEFIEKYPSDPLAKQLKKDREND